jgi:hypothetical protein
LGGGGGAGGGGGGGGARRGGRRPRGRRPGRGAGAPRAGAAAPRAPPTAALRERARREVVEFGEELTGLEENGDTDPARLRAALDSYAAAGTVADRARSVPDLAGVLALLAEGRAALRPGTSRPRRPCFFHPQHGDTARRVRWRPMGRTGMLKVPACDACADAVRGHLPPEVLTDRHEGRDVWVVVDHGTVWLTNRRMIFRGSGGSKDVTFVYDKITDGALLGGRHVPDDLAGLG